jgi:hypothetical protein
MVGVHVGPPEARRLLAGFAGRLLGADELPVVFERFGVDPAQVPDIVAFEVFGGTPGRGHSRFMLAREDFLDARWRQVELGGQELPDRELIIEVSGGAISVSVDPLESDDDPG